MCDETMHKYPENVTLEKEMHEVLELPKHNGDYQTVDFYDNSISVEEWNKYWDYYNNEELI